MKHSMLVVWAVMIAFILAGCSRQELSVSEPWARAAAAGGTGAVYFKIQNSTDADDTLLSVETGAADTAELHQTQMDSAGTMTMQPVDAVIVPAGESVTFEPGGLHVMLIGLKQDLLPDDMLEVRLNFQNAGAIDLNVPVREP